MKDSSKISNGVNRKILIGLILIILIAIGIIIWAYWEKLKDDGLVIIEEPFDEEPFIEIKPSCFDLSQDPVPICNCDDLQKMAEDLSVNYELQNDINCSDTENWNNGKGFNPIGYQDDPFLGTFDGQNYIIVNLFINRPDEDFIGLFCCIKEKIINIGLKSVNIKGRDIIGALVGDNYNGFIANSYASGIVSGNNDTGGLVGRNEEIGTIINSHSAVIVFDGNKDAGGLVGENEGTIRNCYATGSVSSKKGTGGLVGENEGTIRNSYATGNVTGDENVGGFVGDNEEIISDSYAIGIVSGNKDVGGFIGDNHGGLIENCFSTGEVNGFDRIGGLNGVNHGGTITNCFWNRPSGSSLLGVDTSKEGGTVEYSVIENNESYFYNVDNEPMNIWEFPPWSRENNNKNYPILQAQEFIEFPGEEEEEEEEEEEIIFIYNCNDLQRITENLTANYELKNNINCSDTKNWNNGKGFKPIGHDTNSLYSGYQGDKFIGIFDGHSYTITNLFINRPDEDFIGLFGSSAKKIINLGLKNVNITGREDVGGLVGDNNGTIINSYVSGILIGWKDVGGLVGDNDGFITNCYTTSDVSGDDENIGGLVGDNDATITNSYATGDVFSNKEDAGGLVGDNHLGIIDNSYATGKVNSINNVGGFIGNNHEGTISNSYAIGKVSGTKDVGGFIGDNHSGVVENSFSIGDVSGFDRIGGFNGVNHGGIVINCYWNKPMGSSLNCVGANKEGGAVDCHTIHVNESYFYNVDNEPMNIWEFPPWSKENNNKDYPILDWQ